jgi:hypothetical protein
MFPRFPCCQIQLDFHNSSFISDIGIDFDPEAFAETLKSAHVDSMTLIRDAITMMPVLCRTDVYSDGYSNRTRISSCIDKKRAYKRSKAFHVKRAGDYLYGICY